MYPVNDKKQWYACAMQLINIKTGTIIPAMVLLSLFAAIAGFVITNKAHMFDTVVQTWIFSFRTDSLNSFFRIITCCAGWQCITFLCIILLLWPGTSFPFGRPLSFAAILSLLSHTLLKVYFKRPRPDAALWLISESGYGFPSGHAMIGLLFYGLLLSILHRRPLPANNSEKKRTATFLFTVLSICFIFLLGISRIYLGVHYPTDVIGGWCFGCFLLVLFSAFVKNGTN